MPGSSASSSAARPRSARRPFAALVTGARGFVGRRLVRRLRRAGARVTEWDQRAGLDLCDWDAVRKARPRPSPDVVFHLAALSYVPFAWKHPRTVFAANLAGTLNLLEFCRLRRVKRLVYVSSYIYGKPRYLPVDEQHPVAPANPYAWSKYLGEQLCAAYARLFGLRVVIVRPFNIYGPGQARHFLVPALLRQARRSKTIRLDSLAPRRDLLFVEDLVEALVRAARRRGRATDIINLGAGRSCSVREVAGEIGRIAGKKLRLVSRGKTRRGEVMDVVADLRKAARLLKWRPATPLAEGLARTWAEDGRAEEARP